MFSIHEVPSSIPSASSKQKSMKKPHYLPLSKQTVQVKVTLCSSIRKHTHKGSKKLQPSCSKCSETGNKALKGSIGGGVLLAPKACGGRRGPDRRRPREATPRAETQTQKPAGLLGGQQAHFAVEKGPDFSLPSRVGRGPEPEDRDAGKLLLRVP